MVYVSGNIMDDDTEEIENKIKGLKFKDDTAASNILNSLNMMRRNRAFCDVILKVENSEIHAHRAVLASISPHLLELFSAECNNGNGRTRENFIKLNGCCEKDSLEKLVEYAYTSSLDLQPNEVKSVFVAASRLKIDIVTNACAQYLLENLTPQNCLEIRNLNGITKSKQTLDSIDHFINDQFESIRKLPSLLQMPCIKTEVLSQSREEMDLVDGKTLTRLVMDWLARILHQENANFEKIEQKSHLLYLAMDNSLQDCTDLPPGDANDTDIVQDYKKLSSKTKVTSSNGGGVSQEANHQLPPRKCQPSASKPRVLIYNNKYDDSVVEEKGWKLIAEAQIADYSFLGLASIDGRLLTVSVNLRLNIKDTSKTDSSMVNHHSNSSNNIQCTITNNNNSNNNLKRELSDNSDMSSSHSCNGDNDSSTELEMFTDLANMENVKCGAGCANLNGLLLVCGGYDRGECLKSVEIYSPEHNIWTTLEPMLESRGRFNIAVVNDVVYAVGGSNGTVELSTVEKYSRDGRRWERVESIPTPRSNIGVCSLNGKIYCIGGWNGQTGIKQCHCFDPNIGKWTNIASLLTGRSQAGVTSMFGKLWVAGGCEGSWNCLASVEMYDPETNTWSLAKPMITARRGCGLSFFKGKLYAVGGSDGAHSLSSCEVYDPTNDTWIPGPSMTTQRSNVGVAVIGPRLYAVGGFSGKTFLNSIEYLDEVTNEWTTFSPKLC